MSKKEKGNKKVDIEESKKVAEQDYQPTKDQKNTKTEEALSETNKQMQDQYYKGTVDQEKEE